MDAGKYFGEKNIFYATNFIRTQFLDHPLCKSFNFLGVSAVFKCAIQDRSQSWHQPCLAQTAFFIFVREKTMEW